MDDLISKKDLLEMTNISYGQLYRWKRKNIIPEEWFIKKSVPSGQETFFPREKILERIDAIINMKDEASLDDLAQMFSADVENLTLDLEKLVKSRLLNEESVQLYRQAMGCQDVATISDFVGVKLFKDYVMTSQITLEEGKLFVQFLRTHYDKLGNETARVYLIRHMGMPLIIAAQNQKEIIFDTQYKIVLSFSLYESISTIKFQMM